MSWPASRLRRLAPLLLSVSLAACATHPAAPQISASVEVTPPPPSADDQSSAYGLFLAGEAARDEGHFGAAAAYLGRAAEVEGEPAYLKTQAFATALRAGDITNAAALAPEGTDVSAEVLDLGRLTRAVESMAEGKGKDAYGMLKGQPVAAPYGTAAELLTPFAAASAGDTPSAMVRPEVVGDPVGQFVADLDKAEIEDRLGKRQAAEADFKTALGAGDPSGLATESYGLFLERHGRWADAVTLFQTRLAREPGNGTMAAALTRAQHRQKPDAATSLSAMAGQSLIIPAAALINQKQTGVALDYLRFALRLDPGEGEAWLLVGDLLADADPDASRDAYAHVPPSSDNYISARGKLAWSYQNAGDSDAALKMARETAAAAPDSRAAAETLADLLRANLQYPEAIQILTRLIDAPAGGDDWRLYYLRASAYDAMDDGDHTQSDLQAALKLAPDEPQLLNFQGYFWIDRGERLHEALAMVQRAVELDPQSGEIIDSLGWAYYRLSDYPNAVKRLEEAVTLEPGIPEVNDHLGDAYWRVGRKTEAVFQWNRVLSLSPDAKLKARVGAKIASPLGPDAPGVGAAPQTGA